MSVDFAVGDRRCRKSIVYFIFSSIAIAMRVFKNIPIVNNSQIMWFGLFFMRVFLRVCPGANNYYEKCGNAAQAIYNHQHQHQQLTTKKNTGATYLPGCRQ